VNLQSILDIAARLVEIGLIEFTPGMGLGEIEGEYRERVSGTMQDYMDSENRPVTAFRHEMKRITNDAFLLAAVAGWADGGGDGPMPDSLTEYVNQQVEAQFTFIDDVFAKLKELRKSGTADEQAAYIEGRADGYTASIQGIYDYSRVTAAADILLTFDGPDGSSDAICQKTGGTCVKLKGQTHKASWWIEQGLIPYKGNPNFDCGAWKCRHQLFDKDGNVWANQQVSEFDPDQPRDDAGRFSSTGGGGSGGNEGGGGGNVVSGSPDTKKERDAISKYGESKAKSIEVLSAEEFDKKYVTSEDRLSGHVAGAIYTPDGDVFVREGAEDLITHELVHSLGAWPDTVGNQLNEAVTQAMAEMIGRNENLSVRETYQKEVAIFRDQVLPLTGMNEQKFYKDYLSSSDKAKFITDKIWSIHGDKFSDVDEWGKSPRQKIEKMLRDDYLPRYNPYFDYLLSK
jgi:hypothetical protein